MDNKTETVYKIREFNRFYTVLLGLLDRNFLNSEYSVTEIRILFELENNDGCSAVDLIEKLYIDKGYLSRLIKGFIVRGFYGNKFLKMTPDHINSG